MDGIDKGKKKEGEGSRERREKERQRCIGSASWPNNAAVDAMATRMDHQSPDNLYLLGILTMTKGPDRRALTGRPLPATHKAPQFASSAILAVRATLSTLLPRQRADPASRPRFISVNFPLSLFPGALARLSRA